MNKTSVKLNIFFYFIISLLAALPSWAGVAYTTYQAKIIKPDGQPLQESSVNFRFTILDPSGACILFSENFLGVNMSNSSGVISFSLGSGIKLFPVSSTTLADVFNNGISSLACSAGTPATYSPTSSDYRKIVMQFQDSTGWQTLPPMKINAVPYAMFANEALTLNGKSVTDFVQRTSLPTCIAGQALQFNGASFSCVTASGGGISGVNDIAVSGTVLTKTGTASSPILSITQASLSSDGYLTAQDYADLKNRLVASSTQIVSVLGFAPVSSAQVLQQISATGLLGDVSGTLSSNVVASVGGKSSASISASVDLTSAATSSNTSGTLVKRDSSGNFTANDIYVNSAKLNFLDIYKPSTALNIRLQAPASLATNYVLTLPNTSGTLNQVLVTDGAGNLNWANQSVGSITGVTGTIGEVTVSGATSLELGLANTGVVSGSQFTKITVDAKGRVTSGTQISLIDLPSGTLTSASQFSGDVSGTNNNISVNRIKGVSLAITALSNNDILQYNGSNFTNRNIPTCGINQYLTFNGTSYSCQSDAGAAGTITSISATGPLSSTAGTNPVIFIAQASGSADGYLSAADYTTFTNKITSSAVSIAQVLGYVPASATSLGNYLVKSNNLSDLASSATARTNLGLGTFATANALDLGSASATGTIADARLANQASVVSGSQYTKVTVDGKGRVTSGGQLAALDISTALGYSPVSAAAAGITLLNGSTSQTQSFAYGTAGTTTAFVTANGVHTLNIPLASAASVTGGLLSNADYTTFTNKITSSAVSIAQVLGYVPASATSLGNYLVKSNNLSDLASSATARTNLGLGTFATANALDLGSASATGTIATGRIPAFIGDATVAAASNTIVLSNSGVTAGTYTKVTVDGKGRVTSSSSLVSSDITSALGYTPASNAVVSSQWTTSGTMIYYNTGNIGIGTASPSGTVHVVGSSDQGHFILRAVAGQSVDIFSVHNSAGNQLAGISALGGLKARAGSQSAPGLMFVGDTNTGIYNPATGSLGFTTSGTEKMRINSNGNVGIGMTPSNFQLSVQSADALTAVSGVLSLRNTNTSGINGVAFYDSTNAYRGVIGIGNSGTGNFTNVFGLAAEGATGIQFANSGIRRFVIGATGNVGVGDDSTPDYTFDVMGDINADGCVRSSSGTISGTCVSDIRLKKDVRDFTLGLEALLGINPKTYKYNGLGGHPLSEGSELGVIAQDVERTAPALVTRKQVRLNANDLEDTEIKQVNYTALPYVVINAIKELYYKWSEDSTRLQAEVDQLKSENKDLRQQNEAILKRLDLLEKK